MLMSEIKESAARWLSGAQQAAGAVAAIVVLGVSASVLLLAVAIGWGAGALLALGAATVIRLKNRLFRRRQYA